MRSYLLKNASSAIVSVCHPTAATTHSSRPASTVVMVRCSTTGGLGVRQSNGKPRLNPNALSFNLSHSRHLVACAIARAMPVGIDVQRTDRLTQIEQLATEFFSTSEAASIRRAHGNEQTLFFDLWTLKEAFVKAIGLGLSQPLNMFSFVLDEDDSHIRFEAPPGYYGFEWQFALYAPAADARLAVAAHAPMHTVHWCAHETHSDGEVEMKPVERQRTDSPHRFDQRCAGESAPAGRRGFATRSSRPTASSSARHGPRFRIPRPIPPGLTSKAYGVMNVSNLDIQLDDAFHRTQLTSINLMWNRVPYVDIVVGPSPAPASTKRMASGLGPTRTMYGFRSNGTL